MAGFTRGVTAAATKVADSEGFLLNDLALLRAIDETRF